MNKEKLMQFLSDAIDKGSNISVTMYGSDVERIDALAQAHELSEVVNGTVESTVSDTHEWYRVLADGLHVSFFYKDSKFNNKPLFEEEEVDAV